jgi:GNAT superfamily N-acetyltransferase
VQHRSFLLEITSEAFRPKRFAARDVQLEQADVRDHSRCQALWLEVGHGFWTARTRWTVPRWRLHLRDSNVSFWLASLGAEDIGFFELTIQRRGIKIEGFGLLPDWRGQGLGAGLLSAATRQAFQYGAARVRLHTATDDHPNALPNYQARGYRVYRERELKNPMPNAQPPFGHEHTHGSA